MTDSGRNDDAPPDRVALEWATRGTSVAGGPVEYEGVSILEFAGDKVERFRAYFDPAALGRQLGG